MALSTFFIGKVNQTELDLSTCALELAHFIAFKEHPNVMKTPMNEIWLHGKSTECVIVVRDHNLLVDVSLPFEECEPIYNGLKEFIATLGGGELEVSSEYDDVENPTLPEKIIIDATDNFFTKMTESAQ